MLEEAYLEIQTIVDEFKKAIKERKGNITKKISNANIVVCDDQNWDDAIKDKIQAAIDDDLPIVTAMFIIEQSVKSALKQKTIEKEKKNDEYAKLLKQKAEKKMHP